jgi:hypothetical protein
VNGRVALSLLTLLVWALVTSSPGTAAAHEVGMEQLQLRPNVVQGELRGQVTVDPHHTRADPKPGEDPTPPPSTAANLVALLERSLKLEVDGTPCSPAFEVRELWVPGAPTSGDTVMLRCALAPNATSLRVLVTAPIDPLVVTIQEPRSAGNIASHSVLLRSGSYTPVYTLGRPVVDWKPGGANQFDDPREGNSITAPAPSSVANIADSGFREESTPAQAWRYLVLGFEHIVPLGLDHVLFVACLVLGTGLSWRRLLWQLSAFTLAHTVTLALGTLGWVTVSPRIVEPLIALSIAVVALGNLKPSVGAHARTGVIFAFGLLHGLGFAGVLSETGIAGSAFLVSLLSFNAGVELGQLFVVACLLAVLAFLGQREKLRELAVRAGSLGIATVGLWWAVERLLA